VAVVVQDLYPDEPSAHAEAARAALAAGRPLLAQLYAEHMLDAFPDHELSHLNKARALRAQGEMAAAIQAISDGLLRVDTPPLRLLRAEMILTARTELLPGGDNLAAADLASLRLTTVRNEVHRAHYFYLSGLRWERQGRKDRARADFQRAVDLRPEVPGYRAKAKALSPVGADN
jgi:tetratricopeptide (TPR) repeat protein